jgi:hypothetical protein
MELATGANTPISTSGSFRSAPAADVERYGEMHATSFMDMPMHVCMLGLDAYVWLQPDDAHARGARWSTSARGHH